MIIRPTLDEAGLRLLLGLPPRAEAEAKGRIEARRLRARRRHLTLNSEGHWISADDPGPGTNEGPR